MTCGTLGADSNRATLAFFEDVTYGLAPTGNPTLQRIRFTGESLGQDTATAIADEIEASRQVTDIFRTSASVTGDTQHLLSYGNGDKFFEAGIQSADFTSPVSVAAITISFETIATSSTSYAKILDSGNGLSGFVANQIIKVKGSTTSNEFCKIVSVAAGELEVIVINTAGDFASDEVAGDSVTITQGDYITNGTTCRAFYIEEQFSDLTNVFKQLLGSTITGMAISIPSDGPITHTFTWLGRQELSATATLGDGSDTAAPTNSVMTASDNLLLLTENNSEFDIISLDLTLANNNRPKKNANSLYPSAIGSGRADFTGTLTAYFADNVFFDKYLNFTDTSIILVLQDGAGQAYVLDMPALNLTSGRRVASGPNGDVIADMGFTLKKHSTENIMFRLARFETSEVQ